MPLRPLCAPQFVTDGEQDDRLSSPFIAAKSVVAVAQFPAFVARSMLDRRDALFDLAVLCSRHVEIACSILFAIGIGSLGSMLQPLMFLAFLRADARRCHRRRA